MINISATGNNINFYGKKNYLPKQDKNSENTSLSSLPRLFLSTAGFLLCLNTVSPHINTTFENNDNIEQTIPSGNNPTQLSTVDLINAPSPDVVVAGEIKKVGIVVDTETNRLYRYDNDGNVIDGYLVATGKKNRQGKSITEPGLRRVHHIENYPYKCAPNTKRIKNPKAYGPNVLYLTIIDPKTGKEIGSNGEFIHGNDDPESIGFYASKGCMRMDNEVIKKFAKEVKRGTLVLIK